MHNGPKAEAHLTLHYFLMGKAGRLGKAPEGWVHSEAEDVIGVLHPHFTDEGTGGWQV